MQLFFTRKTKASICSHLQKVIALVHKLIQVHVATSGYVDTDRTSPSRATDRFLKPQPGTCLRLRSLAVDSMMRTIWTAHMRPVGCCVSPPSIVADTILPRPQGFV